MKLERGKFRTNSGSPALTVTRELRDRLPLEVLQAGNVTGSQRDPGERTKYRDLNGSGEETWDLSDL